MAEWSRAYHVEICVWCLILNHAHLIAVPQHIEEVLARVPLSKLIAVNQEDQLSGKMAKTSVVEMGD